MKFFLLFILSVTFQYATGQISPFKKAPDLSSILIQPLKARIDNIATNRIESYIAADINRKLYENPFRYRMKKEQPFIPPVYASLTAQMHPLFKQADFNKSLQFKAANMTLASVAEIAGAVLDMALQQYSIGNRIEH